jgi:DNA-binding transcriptional LysR family regulator
MPTSTAALCFVRRSDLVALVPERMCRAAIDSLGLRTAAMPLELPPAPVIAAWHQRYENDRAHLWLRGIVAAAVNGLG